MLEKHQQQYVKKHFRNRPAESIAKHLAVPLEEVEAFVASLKTPDEKRREKVFRVLLALFPVLALVLLEFGLRLAEFGGSVDLFQKRVLNGREYYEINPNVKRRYFRNVEFDPAVSADIFAKRKAPDSYRIFCLGGSSTIGYPYLFNGSFSSMVKDRLVSLFPDRTFEVINVGMTAVNSYTVLDFTKEILRYEPDLILIYSGHNEFYGALGIASTEYLGKTRWFVKSYLALQTFKTFWLVRTVVAWVSSLVSSPRMKEQSGTLMERMVEKQSIPYGSEDFRIARDVYRQNLEEVAHEAQQAGVGVIFSTLVSNWRGIPPFISTFSSQTRDDVRRKWELLFEEGRRRMESGTFNEAIESFQRCIALDALPAKVHYLLAQCHEKLGRFVEAREEYVLAKDYDALRFRASSDFNRVVAEVCAAFKVPLADPEELFMQRSANGIIGDELVLEHLHPTVDGYFLIAKEIVETMRENGKVTTREHWPTEREKTDEEYRRLVGVTRLDSIIADMRIEVLTQSWPFQEQNITVADIPTQTELDKLAKAYLSGELTWEQAHVYAAERYVAEKQYSRAAEEYWAVLKQTPHNVSPYLRLGDVLLTLGSYERAEGIFRKSLEVEETYVAHLRLGSLYERQKSYSEAVRQFELAIERLPLNQSATLVQARYGLAVVLAEKGDTVRAQSELERVLFMNPNFEPARKLLQELKARR